MRAQPLEVGDPHEVPKSMLSPQECQQLIALGLRTCQPSASSAVEVPRLDGRKCGRPAVELVFWFVSRPHGRVIFKGHTDPLRNGMKQDFFAREVT